MQKQRAEAHDGTTQHAARRAITLMGDGHVLKAHLKGCTKGSAPDGMDRVIGDAGNTGALQVSLQR